MGVLGEWSLRISKGLMQEGKRIEEFGLSSGLGDIEAGSMLAQVENQ